MELLVDWSPEAKDLLQKRDRYTREVIEAEFKKNPQNEAIEFDKTEHYYVTPVANRRYTVIWKMDHRPGNRVAMVRAVVPTQFDGTNMERIRNEVASVVRAESNGAIKLF
jgi:hypothetical protein